MLEGARSYDTWSERAAVPTAPTGRKGEVLVPGWVRLGAIVRCPHLDTGRGQGGFGAKGSLYVVERIRACRGGYTAGWIMVRLQRLEPPFYVNGREVGLGHLTPARVPVDWAVSVAADEAVRYTRGDGVVEEPDLPLRARVARVESLSPERNEP